MRNGWVAVCVGLLFIAGCGGGGSSAAALNPSASVLGAFRDSCSRRNCDGDLESGAGVTAVMLDDDLAALIEAFGILTVNSPILNSQAYADVDAYVNQVDADTPFSPGMYDDVGPLGANVLLPDGFCSSGSADVQVTLYYQLVVWPAGPAAIANSNIEVVGTQLGITLEFDRCSVTGEILGDGGSPETVTLDGTLVFSIDDDFNPYYDSVYMLASLTLNPAPLGVGTLGGGVNTIWGDDTPLVVQALWSPLAEEADLISGGLCLGDDETTEEMCLGSWYDFADFLDINDPYGATIDE
ncbi:MAG: hypothetical protein KDH09_08825 [Chrysiogenetes bacterium]|nr:hypothetical protein [Chrysiogenetes bacterium]